MLAGNGSPEGMNAPHEPLRRSLAGYTLSRGRTNLGGLMP